MLSVLNQLIHIINNDFLENLKIVRRKFQVLPQVAGEKCDHMDKFCLKFDNLHQRSFAQ